MGIGQAEEENQRKEEESLRKYIVENHEKNMFVEAGAGAGKTGLIVRKIANMLQNGYEPGEIVVITFTNAAAEELRGRIMEMAEKEAKNNKEVKKKLNNMDQMNISTIHSFCSMLLSEQSVLAGLPQDMKVMDETENRQLQRKYLEQYLGDKEFGGWDELEKLYWKKENDNTPETKQERRRRIRDEIRSIYEQICDLTSYKTGSSEDGSEEDADDIRIETPYKTDESSHKERLETITNDIRRFLYGDGGQPGEFEVELLRLINDSRNDDAKSNGEGEIKSIDEFVDKKEKMVGNTLRFYREAGADRCLEVWDEFFHGKSFVKVPTSAEDKRLYNNETIKLINETAKNLFEKNKEDKGIKPILEKKKNAIKEKYCLEEGRKIEEELEEQIKKEKYYQTVVKYAKKAAVYYRKNRPMNLISNDGLLQLTRDIICNDKVPEIGNYFRKRYKTFFVDEFQDTDHIQTDIIYRLAGDPEGKKELRDGALFLVGDPKQSIYRFRGAEPKNFFAVRERMDRLDNAEVCFLHFNYRSNEEVINWVDEKFADLHKNHEHIVDADTYVYHSMICQHPAAEEEKEKGEHLLKGIYYYNSPDLCGGVTKIEEDVKAAVQLILGLVNDKSYKITEYEKDEQGSLIPKKRNVEYRDFLLICQEKEKMDQYVKMLHKYNIPVLVYGEIKLKKEPVLRTYMRLYKYLLSPSSNDKNEYRMAALEALRVTLHSPTEQVLQETSEKILDSLSRQTKGMTDYGKAQFLEKQVPLLFEKSDIQQATANIETHMAQTYIRQMLEYVFSGKPVSGMELTQQMEDYLENGIERELSLEENANAVRFMNLHKTKGLEGNIVVFLGRTGKKNAVKGAYRQYQGPDCIIYYPGTYRKRNDNTKTRDWASIESIKKLRTAYEMDNRAEFRRLEYVLATRAKQAVVFMDVLNDEKGLFGPDPGNEHPYIFKIGKDQARSLRGLINSVILEDYYKIPDNLNPYDFDKWSITKTELQDSGESNGNYERISPSKLENNYSKTEDAEKGRAKEEGHTMDAEKSIELPRPIGSIMGNVMHRAMELLVNRLAITKNRPGQEELDDIISYSTRQAVAENIADIEKSSYEDSMEDEEDTGAGFDREDVENSGKFGAKEYEDFVMECGKEYCRWLYGEFGDSFAQEYKIYTEIPFQRAYEESGRKMWMNGTADLVLQNKNHEFVLIDYKSDNDYLISETAMHQVLKEKYEPQQDAYEDILNEIFEPKPKDIRRVLVSFSQKDENGKLYSGKKVRVRATELG